MYHQYTQVMVVIHNQERNASVVALLDIEDKPYCQIMYLFCVIIVLIIFFIKNYC